MDQFRLFEAHVIAASKHPPDRVGYLLTVYETLTPGCNDQVIAARLGCPPERLPALYAARTPPSIARSGDTPMPVLEVVPVLLRETQALAAEVGCDATALALLLRMAHLLNLGVAQ